jgi:hypothetical protein
MSTVAAALTGSRPQGLAPWLVLVVQGGTATYVLEMSDRPDLPGTHKLTGNHGVTYGWFTETTGRTVRIPRPGYSGRFGVLGTFDTRDEPNPDNTDPTLRVKGWALTG